MKNIHFILLTIFFFGFISCTTTPAKITNTEDYNQFLKEENTSLEFAQNEFYFWNQKLKDTPNQFPYLLKIAAANTQKFQANGDILHLIDAEENLTLLNEKSNYSKASYLRALARNNISQHKFKNALSLLIKAEVNGENLVTTHSMLFDVYLELGNEAQAEKYLKKIANFNDFNYLIRLSKYNDHLGNLDATIQYLERAMSIADDSKNKSLQQWSYTNLADYYGHAGRIDDSYNYYIKALQINPNDAYAKKGIAWIVYSHERNPQEALRVLNEIIEVHQSPDYYLLKAEIAEFIGDSEEKNKNIEIYKSVVDNKQYGGMYNKYNCLLLAEDAIDVDKALKIANEEIEERPTAQSNDLLAWVYFQKGNHKKALEIVEEHVANKSFEPEVLYHIAQIYKANGKNDQVLELKKELLESIYELGPLMELKINTL